MIVKKMKNKEPNKSIEATIINIIDYINDEQNINNDPERGKILYSGTFNMSDNNLNTDEIIQEMTELATKSKKCKNPISHILLSFDSNYKADIEQLKNIIQDFLTYIDYAGCQTAYAIHQNTDNIHIHLAVNRIDAETFKARSDSHDIDRMHKAKARIESKYNLPTEPRTIYSEIDGLIFKNEYVGPETEITIPDRAREAEIRQGEKSMIRIGAEVILPILNTVKTWQELHERLLKEGFEYVKKGGGAVLIAHHEAKITHIKPSDLARWASLKNMEKKLGSYEPSKINNAVIEPRKAEPMPGIPQQVLDDYKSDKKQYNDEKEAIFKHFQERKKELDIEYKSIIKAIIEYKNSTDVAKNDTELQAALEAYRIVVTDELEKKHRYLISRYKAKLEQNKKLQPPVSDFETWLEYNNFNVNFEQNTNKVQIPDYEQVTDHSISEKRALFEQYHNAVKAEKYRITSNGKDKDGNKIVYVFKDETGEKAKYTAEQVIKNLQYMSNFEAKAEHLYLTPLSEKKHHFFIDDLNYETLLKLKSDGFNPNCVIESSKGNFQAIFTLDKLGTENDQNIINRLASSMNHYYGDVNFCGAIHPHRAPGFYNVKSKNKQPDGTYFVTRIIETNPEQCDKLLKYIREMDEYYTWLKLIDHLGTKAHDKSIKTVSKQFHIQDNDIYLKLYLTHKNHIIKTNNYTGYDIDYSRLDYMIAQRLKATGHSIDETKNILLAGNIDAGRDNKWNLEDYAKRTADRVFNNVHSTLNPNLSKWIPLWKQLENSVLTPNYIKKQEQKNVTNHKLDSTASPE